MEVGLVDETVQRVGPAHDDDYVLGAFSVRLGVSRRTEVEAGWAPLIIDRPPEGGHVTGVGDATFGLRTALTNPDADGLAISAQAFVTAPTATHGQGAGGWSGGVRLPVSVPFGEAWGLGLTPEADLVRDADGRGTHAAAAVAVGVSRRFGAVTLGGELWGQLRRRPGRPPLAGQRGRRRGHHGRQPPTVRRRRERQPEPGHPGRGDLRRRRAPLLIPPFKRPFDLRLPPPGPLG